MEMFLRAFIPLFVAIDVFGALPVFLAFMEKADEPSRRRLTLHATLTALAVALVFLFAGQRLFAFLGITENDFRIGGGIVLLVLAINELLFPQKNRRVGDSTVGVVPIGIPLIMGPAALTTVLILTDVYDSSWALASLLSNIFLVWLVFRFATPISKVLGRDGLRAVSKVIMIFLAAIAVMMIRMGVQGLWEGLR